MMMRGGAGPLTQPRKPASLMAHRKGDILDRQCRATPRYKRNPPKSACLLSTRISKLSDGGTLLRCSRYKECIAA